MIWLLRFILFFVLGILVWCYFIYGDKIIFHINAFPIKIDVMLNDLMVLLLGFFNMGLLLVIAYVLDKEWREFCQKVYKFVKSSFGNSDKNPTDSEKM